MNNPKDFYYTSSHEWVQFISETVVRIGITDYAQTQLGDLVFIEMPEVGDTITAGGSFANVESVKGVSDVIAPVSGTIVSINEELLDAPQLMNEKAFEAWIIEVEGVMDKTGLLTAAEYNAICIC